MGKMSRTKGRAGEQELARLLRLELGESIVRNLEQTREGGADLIGVGAFSVEVKRYRAITPALIRAWWSQAEEQAQAAGKRPALLYRQDRGEWRAVVPISTLREDFAWNGLEWTATVGLRAFCALAREGA